MLEQDKKNYVLRTKIAVALMSGVRKKWTLEMKQLNYLGILLLHFKNLLVFCYLL